MCLNRAQSPNSKKILMSTIQQVVSKKSESFFCRILSVNCKPSNPNSPHYTAIKTNLRCRNLVRTRNYRSGLFFFVIFSRFMASDTLDPVHYSAL